MTERLRCECGSTTFQVDVNNAGSAGYRCQKCNKRAGYSWFDGTFKTTSSGSLENEDD